MDLQEACDTAARLAYKAGGFIRSKVGMNQTFETDTKGKNDYVTSVDRKAEEILVEGLTKAYPASVVLAEETTEKMPDSLPSDEQLWIIDPIDGTTNFMHGLSPYAVSIALTVGGEIKLGVVYEVSQDQLFTAISGRGAYMNGRRMSVTSRNSIADALVATGFPYRRFEHMDEYIAVLRDMLLGVRGIRRNGAASVDLARVALGQYDAFYESGLKPWDVAAGMLLVQEAGGRISDYRGRENPVLAHQMVATNGQLHDQILSRLGPLEDAVS